MHLRSKIVSLFTAAAAASAFMVSSCKQEKPVQFASPRGYNLNKPTVMKMPVELDEISGISYSPKDNSIFAIQDERGNLYKLYPRQRKAVERWKFAVTGDYEDVVLLDKKFYVIQSDGDMSVFSFTAAGKLQGHEVAFEPGDGGGGEFEALYWEPQLKKLVMICKDCRQDKKKDVSCYTFDPLTERFELSVMTLDAEGIAAGIGEKSVKFKASGAAIHPFSGELYVVAAVNKLLVILDRQGRTQKVYRLPPIFKQPEGITFSPSGTLFISNEAADVGVGNILIFPYTRPAAPAR